MKVFLVDDSHVIRERLARILANLEGVQVIGEAEDARDATQSILQLKPDVVILDIQLRGGTGIDVLQSVKREKPAPVVVMLTNFPYPQYRKKCLDCGADYFFDKSTEFENIPTVFRQLTHQIHKSPYTPPAQ